MKLIRKFRPDCLIANFAAVNIMMLVGWFMRVAQRISWNHTMSGALSIDCQHQRCQNRYYRLRKNIVYRLCTYIVSNSKAARSDLLSIYSLPKYKCEVFYNSLDDPLRIENINDVTNKELMKIVCVARLSLSKGQDILIRAIGLLQDKYHKLTVHFIGEGPFRDYYIQLASELNVVERCVFRGELPHGEVLKEMALSSATVCPSRSEAFGFVNIESMAVGTPVIASAVGGIPELIRDGEDGFLVPPEDPVRLAEKIDVLISNPHLRQTMGRKARQNYLTRFEQEKLLLQLSQWLESIVC
jgi:glycosyltransferase involved in cell wall biosynthesis